MTKICHKIDLKFNTLYIVIYVVILYLKIANKKTIKNYKYKDAAKTISRFNRRTPSENLYSNSAFPMVLAA